MDAQAMVEGQDRYGFATRKYTYTFENAASGRKFDVILSVYCMRSIERGGQVIRGEEWIRLTKATLRLL